MLKNCKKATTKGDPPSRTHTTIRDIPHTEHYLAEMLTVLGVRTLDDLIAHLPENQRTRATLDLARGISNRQLIARRSEKYTGTSRSVSFLGAGAYAHVVLIVVDHIRQLAEFADRDGHAYAILSVRTDKLILLHDAPEHIAAQLDVQRSLLRASLTPKAAVPDSAFW